MNYSFGLEQAWHQINCNQKGFYCNAIADGANANSATYRELLQDKEDRSMF